MLTRVCCRMLSNVASSEILKFDQLSDSWRDERGPLKALHSMNSLRVPLVVDQLAEGSNGEEFIPLAGKLLSLVL